MKYHRRVFKIKGEHSPNVRLALEAIQRGEKPSGELFAPGLLTWELYQQRRTTWDEVRQCIGLDAEWWEGKDALMFPPVWLNRAEDIARSTSTDGRFRLKKYMGCDPAEGGDKTAWVVIDSVGIVEMVSLKTPDTDVICGKTIALMTKHKIDPRDVRFDRGGGGKQHVDRLRNQGFSVGTVAFGESVAPDPRRHQPGVQTRREEKEERYVYKNRRAEMYWLIRLLIDPTETPEGFGIPDSYPEIRQQLGPIPLLYDGEGRIELPPKTKKPGAETGKSCLTDLIGHSPDEADALALAVFAWKGVPDKIKAGIVSLG